MLGKKYTIRILILVILGLLISTSQASALKIIPPRLVIKPDSNVQYMFIKNNSNKREYYRFSWKNLAMDPNGKVVNLSKKGINTVPNYKGAEKIIRFSPRRVVLEPGETQRVAFIVRRSSELESGEYRSHFLIQREPPELRQEGAVKQAAPAPTTDASDQPIKQSTVAIDVLISRAVPIYVLNGETQADISLLSASREKNISKSRNNQPNDILNFRVEKSGNRSVIAIADVICKSEDAEVKLNKVSKIFAVYAEANFKTDKVLFDAPAQGCPTMYLRITAHKDDVQSGKILIEKKI